MPDDSVTLSVSREGEEEMAEHAESANKEVAMTILMQEATSLSGRRVARFDQLGADSSSMWALSLQTPTAQNAIALRHIGESGAGRSRVDANSPASSKTTGG